MAFLKIPRWRPSRGLVGLLSFLLFGLFVALALRHLAVPRIIGWAESPEGVQMCLEQEFNWNLGEPFTTRFVFRKPGRTWEWFYNNHQDSYWSQARVEVDTNAQIARFFRGDNIAVTFAWSKEVYTLHRRNSSRQGSQTVLPAGWEPGTQH